MPAKTKVEVQLAAFVSLLDERLDALGMHDVGRLPPTRCACASTSAPSVSTSTCRSGQGCGQVGHRAFWDDDGVPAEVCWVDGVVRLRGRIAKDVEYHDGVLSIRSEERDADVTAMVGAPVRGAYIHCRRSRRREGPLVGGLAADRCREPAALLRCERPHPELSGRSTARGSNQVSGADADRRRRRGSPLHRQGGRRAEENRRRGQDGAIMQGVENGTSRHLREIGIRFEDRLPRRARARNDQHGRGRMRV